MPEVISVPPLAWKLFSELPSLVLMHIQALVSRATSLKWNPEAALLCYLCGFANNVKLIFVPLWFFSLNKQERKVAYSHTMQTVSFLLLIHKFWRSVMKKQQADSQVVFQERRNILCIDAAKDPLWKSLFGSGLSAATSVITKVTHSETRELQILMPQQRVPQSQVSCKIIHNGGESFSSHSLWNKKKATWKPSAYAYLKRSIFLFLWTLKTFHKSWESGGWVGGVRQCQYSL